MIRADPSLAEPLPGADDYLAVEARYAVTHEGARHLDDVLARRTRISIESWDRGVAAAPTVADLMADVLGWDDAEKKTRGRALPGPGRGGARLADQARRRHRRSRPPRRPRHSGRQLAGPTRAVGCP